MKENETPSTFKARISAFESDKDEFDNLTRAQVVPVTSTDIVTQPFAIHWSCRGKLANLAVNDVVICSRFPDGTGIIWCREDGGHTNVFPKNLVVDGDAEIKGDTHVTKTLTADTDVIGGGKSLANHTHTGAHGGTSAPN